MLKNIKISKDTENKIQNRIQDSKLSESDKKNLIHDLKKYQNRDDSINQLVEKYFEKNIDKNGLIINKKLNAFESRNLKISPQQKTALKIIQDKIKSQKNKSEVIIEHKPSVPNLDNFKIGEEDYTSNKLNQYNYSDFLDGKLSKHLRPKITMIVAYDNNYGIGLKGTLPWYISEDLKWFKEYTKGKAVIMGNTNFKDIFKVTKGKGLPERRNIVLSTQEQSFDNFEFFKNIPDILNSLSQEKEIVIIGGTMLYETFLPIADEIIATEVDYSFDTDVSFPIFKDKFICASNIKKHVIAKKSFQSLEDIPCDIYFKRFLRIEPPKYEGISHIKGEQKHYNYTNISWPDIIFIPDILSYIHPDLLYYSLTELIFNTPLPVMTLELLIDTGNLIINPVSSISSWMPDFYSSFMSNPESSIFDFFELSNINFDFIGDIGDFAGDVIGGIFEFISSLFS